MKINLQSIFRAFLFSCTTWILGFGLGGCVTAQSSVVPFTESAIEPVNVQAVPDTVNRLDPVYGSDLNGEERPSKETIDTGLVWAATFVGNDDAEATLEIRNAKLVNVYLGYLQGMRQDYIVSAVLHCGEATHDLASIGSGEPCGNEVIITFGQASRSLEKCRNARNDAVNLSIKSLADKTRLLLDKC